MPLLRYGHAPGHFRDTACQAFEAWRTWKSGPEPTVEYEINYEPHQISISDACKRVWNCTDIVPGLFVDPLLTEGLDIKSITYAACARAILADIKSRRMAG
jgi:hypothetical protein